MQRKRTHSNFVLAAAAAASLAFGGHASAQVIRITNANNHEIPLKSGSSVQIDSAGNLLAECALNTSSQCTALSTGGTSNPGAPTATLTRADSDTDVRTNESISLNWASTNGEACKATSSPSNNSFTGVVNTSGNTTIVPGTVGTHTYTLVCYNANGGSTASTVTVAVTQADGGSGNPNPTDDCTLTSATPGIQPSGWNRVNKTWEQLFTPPDGSPVPSYPSSLGFPVPIGANKGSYTVASFTAQANQSVNMFWDPAQAKPAEGYAFARPAVAMFISISPCAGDLRPADSGSSDKFLMSGCRKYANTGTLITSTTIAASTASACKLEAGKKYYINVLAANPNDGLTTGEHSCSNATTSTATGCDVQARSSLQ